MQLRRKFLVAAASGMVLLAPLASAKETPDTVMIDSFSGAYLAARVAEVDNDLGSAISYYQRALTFDPDNQTLQQSLMLALITSGRFDEALPIAGKLKTVPEIERFSRLALAADSFRKEDYKNAEFWLKLTLESDLDRLITGLMTAWAKAGQGNATDAVAFLDKLEGPEWYGLFKNLHRALILEQAGRDADAKAAYDLVMQDLSAGGAAPETWLRGAEAYAGYLARKGDKQGALNVLDQADEFAPGRVQMQALRLQIAAGAPVHPMVANPVEGASEVLLDLGTALNRGGGESFVRLYLQYALALRPNGDAILLQLAGVSEAQEDPEEAIALYERIPADSPLKRLSELQLGLNLADLDRKDEAIKHLTKLLDAAPDDMRAYLALGGVYASDEKYAEAAKVYDRAVERLPNPVRANWNIFYQRGIAYERTKQWPKAEPNFRKALELFPDQPQVLNYLGYSWVDMNMNLDEALDMIRRAVDLRPGDGYIVDSLGWAYYKLNRFDEAVTELERAVSLKPDDAVLNDHLGDAYWRAGRKLEATFQWSHARDMKPEKDVLAQVEKKLAEGLPPLDKKTAEEKPALTPAPAAEPKAVEPEKRSEVAPATTPAPTEAAPAEAAVVIPAAYTVLPGQSLWSIAVDKLGNGNRYIEILNLNPELQGDPGRLLPGQELKLPQ
ncbi:MAG TPA: tetratricopeptide repeat protein [Rhizobiaceae bacterium]|nr:tetratricopeptide repeat protein [Rhizobiaceae bacterium]